MRNMASFVTETFVAAGALSCLILMMNVLKFISSIHFIDIKSIYIITLLCFL